jgi:hypothetical protein
MKFANFDVQVICNEVKRKYGTECGYMGSNIVVVSETCDPNFTSTEARFLALYVKKRIFTCIESECYSVKLGIAKLNDNLILINHVFLQECFNSLVSNRVLIK